MLHFSECVNSMSSASLQCCLPLGFSSLTASWMCDCVNASCFRKVVLEFFEDATKLDVNRHRCCSGCNPEIARLPDPPIAPPTLAPPYQRVCVPSGIKNRVKKGFTKWQKSAATALVNSGSCEMTIAGMECLLLRNEEIRDWAFNAWELRTVEQFEQFAAQWPWINRFDFKE